MLDLVLSKTRWGRSVFAIGGNVEAARRSGIAVNRVYVSVFVLTSTFAALGGILAAARLAAANQSSGGGDVNLNAIAAAVIGGTSLFGGRGSAYSALLGSIVIVSIASGLTLLNLDASIRFMITGAVLLFAVIIDSLSRRSRVAQAAPSPSTAARPEHDRGPRRVPSATAARPLRGTGPPVVPVATRSDRGAD